MKISVKETDLFLRNVRTRMPFKYGIAVLTGVPHLVMRMTVEVDGRPFIGLAADNLPPKWFTKNPDQSFQDEVGEMFEVIESASRLAVESGSVGSVYELWAAVYAKQKSWASSKQLPPLLWAFGVSLVERALIDAFCKATGDSFARAVRRNTLGLELGDVYEELKGVRPAEALPSEPLRGLFVRHTVGLADPLTDDEIPDDERADDGLPQSLDACIQTYGLRYFKIKLCGEAGLDLERLRRIAGLVEGAGISDYRFTLDGNEQYTEVPPFRSLWEELLREDSIRTFLSRLIVVEQPLRRDVALNQNTARDLLDWKEHPPMIIDESDATLNALPDALEAGYVGTSHKNCKGIVKGIAAAGLLANRRKADPDRLYVQTAEDLTNIGPVALQQDLAVIATLGIGHAERNGHHYFRGLSGFEEPVQQAVLHCHGDLYHRYAATTAVRIEGGSIAIGSTVDAPFGTGVPLDLSGFVPRSQWRFESLES